MSGKGKQGAASGKGKKSGKGGGESKSEDVLQAVVRTQHLRAACTH